MGVFNLRHEVDQVCGKRRPKTKQVQYENRVIGSTDAAKCGEPLTFRSRLEFARGLKGPRGVLGFCISSHQRLVLRSTLNLLLADMRLLCCGCSWFSAVLQVVRGPRSSTKQIQTNLHRLFTLVHDLQQG